MDRPLPMNEVIGDDPSPVSAPLLVTSIRVSTLTLLVNNIYCLRVADSVSRHSRQREANEPAALLLHGMPAQRQAEVLGTLTHAQLTRSILINLQYALSVGIGSGQRQLIAVTCIAEHA